MGLLAARGPCSLNPAGEAGVMRGPATLENWVASHRLNLRGMPYVPHHDPENGVVESRPLTEATLSRYREGLKEICGGIAKGEWPGRPNPDVPTFPVRDKFSLHELDGSGGSALLARSARVGMRDNWWSLLFGASSCRSDFLIVAGPPAFSDHLHFELTGHYDSSGVRSCTQQLEWSVEWGVSCTTSISLAPATSSGFGTFFDVPWPSPRQGIAALVDRVTSGMVAAGVEHATPISSTPDKSLSGSSTEEIEASWEGEQPWNLKYCDESKSPKDPQYLVDEFVALFGTQRPTLTWTFSFRFGDVPLHLHSVFAWLTNPLFAAVEAANASLS